MREVVTGRPLAGGFPSKYVDSGEFMRKKNTRNTRGRIISAAWRLFYEQGYDDTTVEDIIYESGTSKGSFYHYFEGKDALLSSLSYLFDEKYMELLPTIDPEMDSFDKLMLLNRELFGMIENQVSIDLLTRLFSSQLITKGEKHMLDYNRAYYKIIRQIISEGQERGELRRDLSVNDIVREYALCERGIMYDWCVCGGAYSIRQYAAALLPAFLEHVREK